MGLFEMINVTHEPQLLKGLHFFLSYTNFLFDSPPAYAVLQEGSINTRNITGRGILRFLHVGVIGWEL